MYVCVYIYIYIYIYAPTCALLRTPSLTLHSAPGSAAPTPRTREFTKGGLVKGGLSNLCFSFVQ